MFEQDTNAADFDQVWPGGYVETFEGYVSSGCAKYGKADILKILSRFYDKNHLCMEIGCGGGTWTGELISGFKRVIGLDVVPQKFAGDFDYIRLENKDFFCTGVADASIDFVFCFGVFCHLSVEAQRAYLRSMFGKMKSGAKAIVMFANCDRHPHYAGGDRSSPDASSLPATWFYMDLSGARKMVQEAGFTGFTDMIPDFRDTLAYFEKP